MGCGCAHARRDAARRLRRCPVGTEIQTLILPRDRFSPRQAVAWARRAGFEARKIDVTERSIRMGASVEPDASRNDGTIHNQKIYGDQVVDRQRNETVGVSPAWVMIQYGICINVKCGD